MAAAFGLIVIAGALTFLTVLRYSEANRLVQQALEVRQAAQAVLNDMQGAETGQRGFLLTGEERYLEPFNAAQASLPGALDALETLAGDATDQSARVRALRPVIDEKLAELETTVALAREGRLAEVTAAIASDRGKLLMDEIRLRIEEIVDGERLQLEARQASVDRLGGLRLAMISLSLASGAALAIVLAFANSKNLARLRERTIELESEVQRRHEAEDTLRQAQKIEAVGQLTGGIAHDFNNLLTVVIGNLDTMSRRLAEAPAGETAAQLAGKLARPLESANQGARSAAQLTHRLLAFARRQPLEPTRVDLNRLIADIAEMLRRTIGETVVMETVLAGGLWPTFADVNQLENALLNLCVNARDAMDGGGKLTIETANTYLDDAYAARFGDVAPGQYVVLCVTDTGAGIPTDLLERVFEPFFTTKPAGAGTGLGLAMVHGFVKQTGGHVRIYSEVGQGTTVKIYLPRLAEAEARASAPAGREPASGQMPRARPGETVLLVEDNDGVRDYAQSILEDLGYAVLSAADAAQAEPFFSGSGRIDLLFTDVVLPGGVDGRKLAAKVLAKRPGLPVLYTTGYTRNAIVHNGRLDAGVNLLGKPYTQQSLAAKLRELIDGATRSGVAAHD